VWLFRVRRHYVQSDDGQLTETCCVINELYIINSTVESTELHIFIDQENITCREDQRTHGHGEASRDTTYFCELPKILIETLQFILAIHP
jgi:hypothetical protein